MRSQSSERMQRCEVGLREGKLALALSTRNNWIQQLLLCESEINGSLRPSHRADYYTEILIHDT